jgi:Mrp family chromosome partitioning ATPase
VVIVAVLGLLVAVVLTNRRNTERAPEFYATAALIFSPDPSDRSGELLTLKLQDAQVVAIDVNRETMVETLNAAVTFDSDLAELYFSAPGTSEEGALSLARQMRDAFLEVETAVNADLITEQLEDIAEEIGPLEVELAALEEVPGWVLENQSEASYLSRQIASFEQIATSLRLEMVPGLGERDPVTVQSELVAVEREIESLNRQLIALPVEDPLITASRDLQIKAVSRRIQLLELEYQDLYLEQGNLEGLVRLGRATVVDETPAEASIVVNGVLGIVAGLFVSIGGLVLSERTRPMVWLQGDIRSVPLLAQVPRRRPGEGALVWYESASPEGRKSSLQTLRGAIEGRIGSERASIAITGMASAASAVQPLAADLAVGMAVSGRSVLLIDSDFASPSEHFEYSSTGPTLADILSINLDDSAMFATIVDQALRGTPEIRPGLVALRPGEGLEDPADALAGRHLRMLLDAAEDLFDLVIVAAPEIRTPTGQTLLQRVDYAVVSVSPGGAAILATDAVVEDLASRNVAFLGMVLLPLRRPELLGSGVLGRARELTGNGRAGAPPAPAQSTFIPRSQPLRPRLVTDAADNGYGVLDAEEPWAPVTDISDPWERPAVANDQPVSIEFVEGPDTEFGNEHEDSEGPVEADDPEAEEVVAEVLAKVEIAKEALDAGVITEVAGPTAEESEYVHGVLMRMIDAPLPASSLEAGFEGPPDKDTLLRFLDLLDRMKPGDVVGPVEAVLTNWVTSLVATPLQTHHSNRNSVVRYGFIPLFDIRGFSPIRARIRKEFDGPVGVRNARRLLVGIEKALAVEAPEEGADRYSINDWVVDRYWSRHVDDTDREPLVWHLSSRLGSIQALIDWTRLDRDHIDLFRTEMVRQRIETLRRKAKSAARSGKSAEAALFEDQSKDARSLDLSLGWLYDGTTPNARIWYPWRPNESPIGWRPNPRQGVKPHIAPLQRLDLLAFPVLTDEEMIRLKPTG